MTLPRDCLREAGYRFPEHYERPATPRFQIPKSPAVDLTGETIPTPYAYQIIMLPASDHPAIKERFMANVNGRRWAHIQSTLERPKK